MSQKTSRPSAATQGQRRPPFPNPLIARAEEIPDQYAVTCDGNCMAPLLLDGETLVFDKKAAVENGDTVVVLFRPEMREAGSPMGLVKRLVLGLPPADILPAIIDMAFVVVEQLNPPRQYRIPASQILAIHKCVGFADPSGDGMASFRPNQTPPRQPFTSNYAVEGEAA